MGFEVTVLTPGTISLVLSYPLNALACDGTTTLLPVAIGSRVY